MSILYFMIREILAFRLKFRNILNHNIYFVHWDAYKCISIIKFGWVVLTLALKFLCLETLASETRNETCDFSTPFWPLLAHIFVCILRRSYYKCTKYMEQLYNYVLRRHHIKLYNLSYPSNNWDIWLTLKIFSLIREHSDLSF